MPSKRMEINTASRVAQNAVSEETSNDKKVNATKSLSRGLAALLERDQSFSSQNVQDSKDEEKKEERAETNGHPSVLSGQGKTSNDQAKPENSKTDSKPQSSTQRSVHQVPQVKLVQTGSVTDDSKQSSTQRFVHKAPQVQQAQTGFVTDVAKTDRPSKWGSGSFEKSCTRRKSHPSETRYTSVRSQGPCDCSGKKNWPDGVPETAKEEEST